MRESGSYDLLTALDNVRDLHRRMLDCVRRGIDDPEAPALYDGLRRQAVVLRLRGERALRMRRQRADRYVVTCRNDSLAALLSQRDMPENVTENGREAWRLRIFDCVWTSDMWQREDITAASALLTDTNTAVKNDGGAAQNDVVKTIDCCLLVSAITLALWEMMDEGKMEVLCRACEHNAVAVNRRALVGLLICLRRHDKLMSYFPRLSAQVSLLWDQPRMAAAAFEVLTQLQHERTAESVTQKMRDDIFPSIFRAAKGQQGKLSKNELTNILTHGGENPDWMPTSDNADAQDKMREMAEMQQDGADVFLSSFAHMKGHAFFRQMPHWFYPFSIDQPNVAAEFALDESTKRTLERVLPLSPLCESDKYSLVFMLSMIGRRGSEAMLDGIVKQLGEEDVAEHIADIKRMLQRPTAVSHNYICDLYRFFTLYPFHQQFDNPFGRSIPAYSPLDCGALSPLLQHSDRVSAQAEMYMRKGFYEDAVRLFLVLHPQERDEDSNVWQKLGFCKQKSGQLPAAYDDYETALRIDPTSRWTLRHLAATAYRLERYERAADCYEELLIFDGDNLKYVSRFADCLLQLGRTDEALAQAHKACYIDDHDSRLRAQLAWCQLLCKEREKAAKTALAAIDLGAHGNSEKDTGAMVAALTLCLSGRTEIGVEILTEIYATHQNENCAAPEFEQRYAKISALALRSEVTDAQHLALLLEAVTNPVH